MRSVASGLTSDQPAIQQQRYLHFRFPLEPSPRLERAARGARRRRTMDALTDLLGPPVKKEPGATAADPVLVRLVQMYM